MTFYQVYQRLCLNSEGGPLESRLGTQTLLICQANRFFLTKIDRTLNLAVPPYRTVL